MSTYVIAEAGSCHDKSVARALDLIDAAKIAGADAVKFQFWSSAERLAQRRNAPDYLPVYRKYAVPLDWLVGLHEHATTQGLGFLCTTYLPEDVPVIAPLVHTFKIASFEANDPELLAAHVPALMGNTKRVLISLGMGASIDPVITHVFAPLLKHYEQPPENRITFLHCVSSYPTPPEQLNLRRLIAGDVWIEGFSDHAPADHTWTGALAVAAGATVLERHLRLDSTFHDNPDAEHAMNPRAFREYVRHVRYAETVMGTGQHGAQPCESAMRDYRVWRN